MWASSTAVRAITVVALSVAMPGCAVGPNFVRPPAPAVSHYAFGADPTQTPSALGTAQRFVPGKELRADWWHLFRCSALDDVIAAALARNPGVRGAQASLRQSEDSLRSGYGVFYPQVSAGAAATRQRSEPLQFGQQAAPTLFNLFTLSTSVHYALDVFGGQRRMIEALGAGVDLQRATLQATYVTLISNVVNTVVARAAYRAQMEATQELIRLETQQVAIAEVQARAGTLPYSGVLSLRVQLAANRATMPALEQRVTQSNDLLASLTGHAPAQWQPPDIALGDLTLPDELPVTVPSRLVRQRPDILAAEATAHYASANVGVATAALLPDVALGAAYSANGPALATLFSPPGRAWDISAAATQPLFAGGTLWFKRKAAVDSYEQAAALYQQTVLDAFAQVADTLRALEHDSEMLAAQDEALGDAREALKLVQVNYAAGIASYLDVLTADAQYQTSLIDEFQSVALRYQDTVALYAALGGGWWKQAPG
ncbi:MAG: efflux transporter outer membrane subunit [Proteobacteria bacterium]|nr:efflux transporter outer membrane subunit [Pseudomonadota bacterium]